jgi:hypothetical protein
MPSIFLSDGEEFVSSLVFLSEFSTSYEKLIKLSLDLRINLGVFDIDCLLEHRLISLYGRNFFTSNIAFVDWCLELMLRERLFLGLKISEAVDGIFLTKQWV